MLLTSYIYKVIYINYRMPKQKVVKIKNFPNVETLLLSEIVRCGRCWRAPANQQAPGFSAFVILRRKWWHTYIYVMCHGFVWSPPDNKAIRLIMQSLTSAVQSRHNAVLFKRKGLMVLQQCRAYWQYPSRHQIKQYTADRIIYKEHYCNYPPSTHSKMCLTG